MSSPVISNNNSQGDGSRSNGSNTNNNRNNSNNANNSRSSNINRNNNNNRNSTNYRGNGSNQRNNYSNSRNNNNNRSKGAIEEFGYHVYDCTGKGVSDLYERTTRKLADYVGKEYSGAMRYVIENLEKKQVIYPSDLALNATATEKLIYDAKIKEIVKRNSNRMKILRKCTV